MTCDVVGWKHCHTQQLVMQSADCGQIFFDPLPTSSLLLSKQYKCKTKDVKYTSVFVTYTSS